MGHGGTHLSSQHSKRLRQEAHPEFEASVGYRVRSYLNHNNKLSVSEYLPILYTTCVLGEKKLIDLSRAVWLTPLMPAETG